MILAENVDELAITTVSSTILAFSVDELAVFPGSSMILAENVDESHVFRAIGGKHKKKTETIPSFFLTSRDDLTRTDDPYVPNVVR